MFPGPITILLRLTLATATLAGPATTTVAHLQLPPGLMTTGSVTTANFRTTATIDQVDLAALQSALDGAVAAGVPGIVYLIRDGNRTRILTSGTSDLATGRPIRARDKFRVASITKTFVATAVLQLQARGRLDLDAPVAEHLPTLLPDGDSITARQLLAHTSGLFDYIEDPGLFGYYRTDPLHVWRPEDLITRFSLNRPPTFPPGTDFGYSNTGYLVLGLLIEKITGEPLERVLQHQIFGPLHLSDTSMPTGPEIRGPHAHGYTDFGDGGAYVERDLFDPSLSWAAGAIVSTVADVADFYQALLTGHLLPAAQLAQMTTFRDIGDDQGYGLGLQQQPYPCATVHGHTGGGLGFSTDAETTLDGHRQTVVFANAEGFPEAAYEHFGHAAQLAYC